MENQILVIGFQVFNNLKINNLTTRNLKTIADLKRGERGIIVNFTDDELSLKLLEMGCLPGTQVTMTHIAPFGDPIAVKVSGYVLSMRKDEAETIIIA